MSHDKAFRCVLRETEIAELQGLVRCSFAPLIDGKTAIHGKW